MEMKQNNPVATEAQAGATAVASGLNRTMLWTFLTTILLISVLAFAGSDPAYAQDGTPKGADQPAPAAPPDNGGADKGGGGGGGGGGDPISGFLQAVITSFSGWITLAGVLGLLCCGLLKAVAGTNEHRHQMANAGFVGCGIAVAVGLMAQPIVDMISGWAGGGAG